MADLGIAAGSAVRPSITEVLTYATAQIHRAAADLWPGEPAHLEQHVPSVTSYVCRARIGDRTLYAKTSILGVSLVSLLRGACGTWADVAPAQREYEQRPDSLPEREAAQLRLLARMNRPQVCALAGVSQGVIFTEPVPGPTLGDLILARPADTAELLSIPLAELRPLHDPAATDRLNSDEAIGERSVADTFARKFNGLSGPVYVQQLGAERYGRDEHQAIADLARSAVARLLRLRWGLALATPTTLTYGDLKPEHVLFPGGPERPPVLLDPGLLRADPTADAAKLLSRTVLLLTARQPGTAIARQIVAGVDAFGQERRDQLRDLLTLWLMDTVNTLSTLLSAPPLLPLPGHAKTLTDRAMVILALVNAAAADLATGADIGDVWERALDHVLAAAS
jgi:hypothetical protein